MILKAIAVVFSIGAMLAAIAFCFWTIAMAEDAARWNRSGGGMRWWGWPLGLLVYAGFSILVFGGTKALLWWMPASWGSADEDGTWISTARYIAGLVAFFGGFLIPAFLFQAAQNRVSSDRLRNTENFLGKVVHTDNPARLDELCKEALQSYQPTEDAVVVVKVLHGAMDELRETERRVNQLEEQLKGAAEHSTLDQEFREHLYARLAALIGGEEPPEGVADQLMRAIKAAGIDPIDSEVKLHKILARHYPRNTPEILAKLKIAAGPFLGSGGALCCLAFKDVPRALPVGHFQFDVGIGLASMENLEASVTFDFIHVERHTVMVD